MQAHDETRIRFEAAVVERLKESGFLEIEIRTECLARVDDGYQDEVINAGWHYWQAGMADGRNQQSVEMYKVIKPQTTGKTDALLHLFADPALIGIPEEMIESGGHWRACTGCYDTEDGYPTQKYLYSPTLQTEIGCGCTECGGIGAVWWYMSDEDVAEFAKCCEEIDREIVLEARIDRLERALHKIASPTQTEDLLWWQIEARQALGKEEAAPAPQAGWEHEAKLTVKEAWTILCETPDITSPAEYPDHALITIEQLGSFMERATPNPPCSPQWLPIAKADRSITQVQEFPSAGITLRNSDRYWVRDDLGGLPYEASWSEGRNGQSYWWAWEAESPVNPSEFMPHPLDPRYRETADKDQDIEKCPICDAPFQLSDLLAHDIELGACHAECLKGSPVVDLDTGEETGGEITTFRYGDRDDA